MVQISVKLLDVHTAVVGEIGPNKIKTGIFKKSIKSPIFLSKLGLTGDIQVDRRVHGGFEKAVHHYPSENYTRLKQVFTHLQNKEEISVGENFSTLGIIEADLHIGDIFTIGSAVIQVSQPRMPCWKLNHKIGNAHVASLVISEAITGWYYRVIEEGILQIGDKLILTERLQNSISIQQLWQFWLENKTKKRVIHSFKNIVGLSNEWTSD